MSIKQIIRLWAQVMFLFLPILLSLAKGNPEPHGLAELEARVKIILAKDNVSQRREVNDIFKLADIYAAQGDALKAGKLYETGLAIDSFRLDYQLKLADILRDKGDANQAVERYKTVYAYAEDERIINSAKERLQSLKVDCTRPEQEESKFKIVVVPIGEINRFFVDELMTELNRATGIRYELSEKQLPVGEPDRTNAQRYLSMLCEKIKSEKPNIKPLPDTAVNAQMEFIIGLMRKDGVKPEDINAFRTRIIENFQVGQRNADRLISELKKQFGSDKKPDVDGYLGITAADIYSGDNNYLFGWAQKRFGVMSYCRFTAGFNKEPEHRPRLLKRALKQGISSTFFILNIPRCSNVMCVRAYPHSLSEQDLKGIELCEWCKQQLRKKLEEKEIKSNR
ncbi:MAG: hypothetical protein JW749_11000 [Sedimentisphaerales bacterium]|nr:hypothetical protein [Sedimentisphaerales bacterium]